VRDGRRGALRDPRGRPRRGEPLLRRRLRWRLEPFGDVGYLLAATTPTGPDGRPTEPGAINGALMQREPDAPAPVPVVGVDSVEDALARVEAAGGAVVRPKAEIPSMGWYAYVRDPEGTVIGLWEAMVAS